jgi:hypothetical protein
MAWSRSAIFRAWLECALAPVPGFNGGWDLPGAVGQRGDFRCSLWRNLNTPDETAPLSQSGLSTIGSAWQYFQNNADGRDSTGPPNGGPALGAWPTGGPTLTGTGPAGGFTSAEGLITFGADNATSNGPCTMDDIYGDMVFHFGSLSAPPPFGTVIYQGVCFHYYGGECDVVDGTFTVVWPPERVAQIQLT